MHLHVSIVCVHTGLMDMEAKLEYAISSQTRFLYQTKGCNGERATNSHSFNTMIHAPLGF